MKSLIGLTLFQLALLSQGTMNASAEEAFENRALPPVRVFAEALAARQRGGTEELKISAEYWISQSLLQSGLNHIAYAGFSKMAANSSSGDESATIQGAAIAAINQIHSHYPSFLLPAGVFAQIPHLMKSQADTKKALREFVFTYLIENPSKKIQQESLELLQGSGAYEHLARGIIDSQNGEHPAAIMEFNTFLRFPSIPAFLEPYVDHAILLLSRSYFSTGAYTEAAAELGKIKKSSNDLAELLAETAWAHLMNEKYGEAIGTAMSLRAGGLRHTFSPEAPMVMAMALNELCQFPESITTIQQFKRDYEKSYLWLSSHQDVSKLYPSAISFLKRQGDVPDRIGTEWVRSPLFISSQEEINLLFQENQANLKLGKTGAVELKKLGLNVHDLVVAIKPAIKKERAHLKPGEHLSSGLVEKIHILKEEINHYKRLRNAATTWHRILKNHDERVPILKNSLVQRINQDLKTRTERMFAKLEDIAENNQLIEVEIYNGASQDIIWQNAHPEYKEIAQKMNREQKAERSEKVWDWGHSLTSGNSGESEEIWEDELGSFQASLFNNCSSKQRFLALHNGRRRS